MGSGHSEYLKYITQSINASAPRGITAAQVWCAQTAEAVGLCTGNELETLMLGRTGGYRSWDPDWNTFQHESSFPSGQKRGFPSCTAMCQLCWDIGMSQMEGSQTDWHCEIPKILGSLCSRNRFFSCLAIAPKHAPTQEKLSCHSALLSGGDVTLGVSAMLLSTVWASNLGRTVRCSWQTPPAGSRGVLRGSGIPVIQHLPANWKQCFLLLL